MSEYDETGRPLDKSYLEQGLPPLLKESIEQMIKTWEIIDNGGKKSDWDCDYCELQSNINCAEVDQYITSEQAWYLREKYLRMERTEEL
ncbi:MAG: hypothetical protein J6A55_02925 [Oscillospiraceae bacterium]|nr:hypothetical protein [Oscillospiraceae bacterium]